MKNTTAIVAAVTMLYGVGLTAIAGAEVAGADRYAIEVAEHRLIGFGCGAARETLTAREEDEFPVECEEIETVAKACKVTSQRDERGQWKELRFETLSAAECAAYWGNGY
jgi:hypothetical protein